MANEVPQVITLTRTKDEQVLSQSLPLHRVFRAPGPVSQDQPIWYRPEPHSEYSVKVEGVHGRRRLSFLDLETGG